MTNYFKFKEPPRIGYVLTKFREDHILLESNAHISKKGNETFLLTWSSNCVQCSQSFEQVTGMNGYVKRRCKAHTSKKNYDAFKEKESLRKDSKYQALADKVQYLLNLDAPGYAANSQFVIDSVVHKAASYWRTKFLHGQISKDTLHKKIQEIKAGRVKQSPAKVQNTQVKSQKAVSSQNGAKPVKNDYDAETEKYIANIKTTEGRKPKPYLTKRQIMSSNARDVHEAYLDEMDYMKLHYRLARDKQEITVKQCEEGIACEGEIIKDFYYGADRIDDLL